MLNLNIFAAIIAYCTQVIDAPEVSNNIVLIMEYLMD